MRRPSSRLRRAVRRSAMSSPTDGEDTMRLWITICLAALAFGADCSNMMAQTLTTLATFNGGNGDSPGAGMVVDSAGNFYGTTFYGGDFGYGTVFEMDAVTHALT